MDLMELKYCRHLLCLNIGWVHVQVLVKLTVPAGLNLLVFYEQDCL